MGTLTHNQLLRLRKAVISAGLAEERAGLLAGVPPEVVAGLPRASTPGAQLLTDLDSLNEAGFLENGSLPLATWLENAAHLAQPRQETLVFREVLSLFAASTEMVGGPPQDGSSPEATSPVESVASSDTDPSLRPNPVRKSSTEGDQPPIRPMKSETVAAYASQHTLRHLGVVICMLAVITIALAVVMWPRRSGAPSYRGVLRDLKTGQPFGGAAVTLLGTSCVSITTEIGVFDFDECKDDGVSRLVNPQVSISMRLAADSPVRWDCQDIPLRPPPEITEVRFDPERCMEVSPPSTLESSRSVTSPSPKHSYPPGVLRPSNTGIIVNARPAKGHSPKPKTGTDYP
jgi:hypothetical protein